MKHKMWSRLLSMVLAVMMIASIVPSSAFAEATSEIVASSQATVEVAEETEEVTLPEDTTTEEPAAETPAEEPAAETPAEEPAGEPAPTAEPVAEPTAEPVTESEQPAAEPTQAPAETAVPSEQPSAEPTAAPEGTETPEGTAVPTETPAASATPAPSESPVPSETPLPSETPAPSEEPAIDGQALLDELMAIEDDEAFMKAVSELTEEQTAALEALGEEALAEYTLRVESLTTPEETVELNAEAKEFTTAVEGVDGVTVTVKVPEGALPVDAELKADLIAEETEEFAQAQAALDEQQVEYDGMIALDIRFELNGEEVEPLFPVEVTIDAKAMLPEDADPETVAVQHLEENEAGEVTAVKTVADAAEETGDVTVEATQTEEPAMDMASTFAVDGFSTFAITWGNTTAITVVYCDESGNQIAGTQAYPLKGDDENEIVLSNYAGHINGYEFSNKAYWGTKNGAKVTYTFGRWGTTTYPVYSVKLQSGYFGNYSIQYKPQESPSWWSPKPNNVDVICLVYRKNSGTPQKIETVATKELGIKINLYDYDLNWINQGSNLQFSKGGISGSWLNQYVAQGTKEIVQNQLNQAGYPILNDGSGTDLDYLFTNNRLVTKAYEGLDHLFIRDSDGYYVYDSVQNFAKLSDDNKNFIVYDQQSQIINGDSAQPNVLFAPFNNYNANIDAMNYYFGMTIETDFVMPAGGRINGKDMTFEFSGDDDVWVFLDGQLVLDLGGIHDECPGTINFNTGTVYVNGEEQRNLWGITEGKWQDYSEHTLKFFYLERGAFSSNCKIKFNLPTVPEGSLNVGKTVSGETANHDYKFQVTYGNGNVVGNAPYTIQGTAQSGATNSQGYFTLKAGQMATFSNLESGNYTVTEVANGYSMDDYTTTVTVVNGDNTSSGNVSTSATVSIAPSTTGTIGFTNTKIEKGAGKLTITKSFVDENGDQMAIPEDLATIRLTVKETYAPESFNKTHVVVLKKGINNVLSGTLSDVQYYTDFQIEKEELLDKNGDLIANSADWTIGDFVLDRYSEADSHGTFYPSCDTLTYTLQNSGYVLVETGKIWYLVMNHVPDSNAEKEVFKAMVIDDILAGISQESGSKPGADDVQLLTVQEAAEKYSAEVGFGEAGNVTLVFERTKVWSNFYAGSFDMTKVTMQATLENVLNKDKVISIDVTKAWEDADGTPIADPGVDSVTVKLFANGADTGETVALEASENWKSSFTNLAKYNSDGTLIKYTVDEVEVPGYTSDITGDMQTGFTITNTPSEGYLKINKVIQGDAFGGGKDVFSFKIEGENGKTWYMHVNGTGDATLDGTETQLKLDAGEYTVTELDNINYTFISALATNGGETNSVDQGIIVNVGGNDTTIVTFTNARKDDPGITDGSGVINSFQKNGNVITITGTPVKNEDGSKDDTVVTDKTTTSGE